jgi:hypothetical protein
MAMMTRERPHGPSRKSIMSKMADQGKG